jgi:hypothetical protein
MSRLKEGKCIGLFERGLWDGLRVERVKADLVIQTDLAQRCQRLLQTA